MARGKWFAAIAVFGLATTAVGFLVGPDIGAREWSLPEPMVGDYASYQYSRLSDYGPDASVLEEPRPALRFRWDAPSIQHDYDGEAHFTNSFWMEDTFPVEEDDGSTRLASLWTTNHLGVHDGSLVATNRTQVDVRETVSGPETTLSSEVRFWPAGERRLLPCGVQSPLHGQTFAVWRPVRLFEDCAPQIATIWLPDHFSYEAVGIDNTPHGEAIRFRTTHAPNDLVIDFWFTKEIPYPVRVASLQPDGSVAVLDLAEFRPGHLPLATSTAGVQLDSVPPVAYAERHAWGLDEAGIDHPWKASDAWTWALQDPNWSALRDLVAQHPDIMAQGAHFHENTRMEGSEAKVTYSWSFVVAAPEKTLHFQVFDAPYQGELVPGWVPELDPPERERYVLESDGNAQIPVPSTVRTSLPTVDSLWRQWEAQRSTLFQDDKPNTWGVQIYCADGGDCAWAAWRVWAGHQFNFDDPGVPPPWYEDPFSDEEYSRSTERKESLVRIGDAHSEIYRTRGLQESWRGWGAAYEGPPKEAGAEITVAAVSTSQWNVPTVAWWVGAGLLGTLVAGLVWLWPGLKMGTMSLFSRHQSPEEVLQDPTRRRVLESIREEPGIHLRALALHCGVSRSTVLHHLAKLQAFGLVQSVREGRYTCHFPGGRLSDGSVRAAAAVRSSGAKRLMAALDDGPMDVKQASMRAGMSLSTAYYHLRRLEAAGLVDRDGPRVRLA